MGCWGVVSSCFQANPPSLWPWIALEAELCNSWYGPSWSSQSPKMLLLTGSLHRGASWLPPTSPPPVLWVSSLCLWPWLTCCLTTWQPGLWELQLVGLGSWISEISLPHPGALVLEAEAGWVPLAWSSLRCCFLPNWGRVLPPRLPSWSKARSDCLVSLVALLQVPSPHPLGRKE